MDQRAEDDVAMQFQRCPSCRDRNDVSVYVHGQLTRCVRCGIRFTVDRENFASHPDEARVTVSRPGGRRAGEPATDISAVRGGVGELIPTKAPVIAPSPAGRFPSPLPLAQAVGEAVVDEGLLADVHGFPTPAQRANSPARAPAPPEAPTETRQAAGRPDIPGLDCSQLLGRGGMGEVWKAQQLSLGRIVAVKLLSPTLAVEPDFIRRFERESTALATLAHPNIVAVFDRGAANGHWYFVMEYVEGRSLRDRLAEGAMPRAELLRLLAQVGRAVDYAHQKGVIHRDLKPENILVDHAGNAKVADFGLAGMSEVGRSSLTMSAVAMGTAHYMAPEQRRDAKKVDGRADLYSLGVILYEVLTGELPAGRFQTPREKIPTIDPRLDSMILRLLDQDPGKRPAKASEIADLLERLAQEERGERGSPPLVQTTKVLSGVVRDVRASPAKKAMFAVAMGLLLVVMTVAIIRGSAQPPASIRLTAKVDRPQPGRAQISFGAGSAEALLAVGGGWEVKSGELIREAEVSAGRREARTYLMPVRLDFTDAALEADVIVDDLGAGDEPPRFEIVLYRDVDRHVGLRVSLAEDASYSLFYAVPVKGKTSRREEEGTSNADPQPGRKYHLELYLVNGRATAFVDKRQVASAAIPGLAGVKAKAALGCRSGRCRFSNVKLAGAIADPPSPAAAQR